NDLVALGVVVEEPCSATGWDARIPVVRGERERRSKHPGRVVPNISVVDKEAILVAAQANLRLTSGGRRDSEGDRIAIVRQAVPVVIYDHERAANGATTTTAAATARLPATAAFTCKGNRGEGEDEDERDDEGKLA